MTLIPHMKLTPQGYANELYHSLPIQVAPRSGRPVKQHGADMANRLGGVKTFRTYVDAVLNPVTAKHAEGVVQLGQAILCRRITTVGQESIRLQ